MEYRYTITNDPKKGILLINAQGDEVAATDILDKCSSARVFAFDGKMGAGKTTFIKQLCETMGTKDVVNSPTFAIVNVYDKIFELIIEMSDKFDRVKFNDSVSARLACKMSVKANTNISYQEQEELINRLFKCDFPYTCPHGRPTIIKYPIYELEKLFKRVN